MTMALFGVKKYLPAAAMVAALAALPMQQAMATNGMVPHGYGAPSKAMAGAGVARTHAPVRRSFRIHGHSTTIRLEQAFWETLETIAVEESLTVAALMNRIHDHCQIANERNLASCLRVICLKFIEIQPSPAR